MVIGLVAGVVSLVLIAASGVSLRALGVKAGKALRTMAKKLGLNVIAHFLDKHGYPRLARLLNFEWSDLLISWDPEGRAAERAQGIVNKSVLRQTGHTNRTSRKPTGMRETKHTRHSSSRVRPFMLASGSPRNGS